MQKKYRALGIWGLFFVGVLILLVGARNNGGTPATAGEMWQTDFDKAKEIAASQGKDLLIDFAGSDWCYWCKKLDREVFSDPIFEQEAAKDFVFVLIDFPQNKSGQSTQLRKQNEQLAQRYGVSGFPTVILADADGVPYARTGYREGGAQQYLAYLKQLRTQQKGPVVKAEIPIP